MSARRKHFKVENLPVEAKAFVDEELSKTTGKLTYDQITQEVEARWGEKIAVSSLSRYRGSFEHQKEKMAYLLEQAQEIMGQLNGLGIELGEMAQAMVTADITYILAQGGHDPDMLSKMGRTLALLGRAGAQQAQVKVRHGKAFKSFERRIKERLRQEVSKDPELAERLEGIVADEAERMAKESA
ncbi:DUF3486 family protein [Nitrospinae bacterium AH_259_B05_G02_I21]|nr:DUF3486 family protein [Nitrospinae bacterium AH_259_B05_G02_I21]